MPVTKIKFYKGFTLIELLVVISIIAILMAVATVSYTNAQQKGRDSKRKSDLKSMQQSLEMYYQQNGKYPAHATLSGTEVIACNLPGDNNSRNWGGEFYCDPTGTPDPPKVTYMNPLPKDPAGNTTTPYYYYTDNTTTPPNQSYKIFAKIENTNDKDLLSTPTLCNSGNTPGATWQTGGLYYCVVNP